MITMEDPEFEEDRNVFSTTDYDKFQFIDKNRHLKEFHVKNLMQSIAEKNLLHRNPILVTKDFFVIDGQNRLEAARRLPVPIYYKFENHLELGDIIKMNVAQLKWGMEDYLHYYVVENRDEYVAIDQMLKKYPRACLSLLIKLFCADTRIQKQFKKGLFKFDCPIGDVDALLNKVNMMVDHLVAMIVQKKGHQFIESRTFAHALALFFRCGNVDYVRFVDQITKNVGSLRPCTACSYYVELFIQIYNYNHKKEKERLKQEYFPEIFKRARRNG